MFLTEVAVANFFWIAIFFPYFIPPHTGCSHQASLHGLLGHEAVEVETVFPFITLLSKKMANWSLDCVWMGVC